MYITSDAQIKLHLDALKATHEALMNDLVYARQFLEEAGLLNFPETHSAINCESLNGNLNATSSTNQCYLLL